MKLLLLYISTTLTLFSDQFSDYWYSGKAEVAVYDLQQSRYGKIREGKSVLIFVSEPFSKSKHVKLDYPSKAGKDKTPALKMNRTKSYATGIYPYSVMTSAFAEVDTGKLLKATTSVQEWCGHVYMQADAKGKDNYTFQGHSYFESEGEQKVTLKNTSLEESILLQIRLNKLQEGKINLTPSQEQSRMLHFPYQPTEATVEVSQEADYKKVTVSYAHPLKLNSEIHFAKEFPYHIVKWVESFEKGGKTYSTTATLKTIQQLPYWSMNSPEFDSMRKEIGLEE